MKSRPFGIFIVPKTTLCNFRIISACQNTHRVDFSKIHLNNALNCNVLVNFEGVKGYIVKINLNYSLFLMDNDNNTSESEQAQSVLRDYEMLRSFVFSFFPVYISSILALLAFKIQLPESLEWVLYVFFIVLFIQIVFIGFSFIFKNSALLKVFYYGIAFTWLITSGTFLILIMLADLFSSISAILKP